MNRLLPIIIPIIAALVISFPFFQSGYVATDDGEWAIIRLAEMKRELRDGQFPARWSDYLNHGYGYPLFNFAYPLPYYLGALVSGAGIGLVSTTKVLFVASVVLSGVGMFFLARELTGVWGGIIASLLYVSAPFRLIDLYQRGSLGESLAFAVFPFLCYAGIRYIVHPTVMSMIVCSLAMAGMIMMHNALAFLFLPFWFLFLIVTVISYSEQLVRYSFRYFLPMILLGLGISAFFWFPAIAEKQFVALSQQRLADPSQHMVTVSDYLYAPWFTQGKREFALGWVHLFAFFSSLIVYLFSGAFDRKKHRPLVFFLVVGLLVCFFLTTRDSLYLWEHTTLTSIDFPWRLLAIIVFFLSLGAAFLGLNRYTMVAGLVIATAAVISTVVIGVPIERIDRPDEYYETNDATTTSADELMPLWVKEKPADRPSKKVVTMTGSAEITDMSYSSRRIAFRVSTSTPSVIRINTIYYPGWQFTIEDQPARVSWRNAQGLMELDVANGSSAIIGTFSDTVLRKAANGISIASGLFVILLWFRGLIRYIRPKRRSTVEV